MREPGAVHGSSGVWFVRLIRRTTWLSITAGLLMSAWLASADETEKEPQATGREIGTATTDVDDTELDASYGKGYPLQGFQPQVAIPVILWDEGKRKTYVQDTGAVVVTHGRSDIHLQGMDRPR